MNPSIVKEIIALLLVVIFVLAFQWSIPPMVYMVCYGAVVAMFVVFVFSLLADTDRDERERQHRSIASEVGYVLAGGVLLAGIAHQTFLMHHVDLWLFAGLIAMMAGRLITRLYLDKKQ